MGENPTAEILNTRCNFKLTKRNYSHKGEQDSNLISYTLLDMTTEGNH